MSGRCLMAVNLDLVAMLSHPFTRHHYFFPSLLYLSSTLQQQLHITEVRDLILRHLEADWYTRIVFDQRCHHPTRCLWAANYNCHLSKTWACVVQRQKAWLSQPKRGPWRAITLQPVCFWDALVTCSRNFPETARGWMMQIRIDHIQRCQVSSNMWATTMLCRIIDVIVVASIVFLWILGISLILKRIIYLLKSR